MPGSVLMKLLSLVVVVDHRWVLVIQRICAEVSSGSWEDQVLDLDLMKHQQHYRRPACGADCLLVKVESAGRIVGDITSR